MKNIKSIQYNQFQSLQHTLIVFEMDFEVSEIADESILSVSSAKIAAKIKKKIFVLISLFWNAFKSVFTSFRNLQII